MPFNLVADYRYTDSLHLTYDIVLQYFTTVAPTLKPLLAGELTHLIDDSEFPRCRQLMVR